MTCSPVEGATVRADSLPTEGELQEACAKIPGPNVLSASSKNIFSYACGAFSLVERDMVAVLPLAAADDALARMRRANVPGAFRIREELVNYKKVALYMHQESQELERSLGQLAAFFREGRRTSSGFWVHTARRTEVSDARTRCKGRVAATFDARNVCKQLCCVARYPGKPRGEVLQRLPQSLRCWRLASDALELMARADGHGANLCGAGSAAPPAVQEEAAGPAPATAELAAGWPEHVGDFVRQVLVCRGADKALRICMELALAVGALELTAARVQEVLGALALRPGPGDVLQQLEASGRMEDAATDWELGGATLYHKHTNLLQGCLPALRELTGCLRAIVAVRSSDPGRLFVAGDGSLRPAGAPPASFLPAGAHCGESCRDLRRVLATYGPQMQEAVVAGGWPDHLAQPLQQRTGGRAAGRAQTCKVCERASALWVHRGVCPPCEEARRAEGRCPFGEGCAAAWFCPHDRRCLACDRHSCGVCRFSRGDGEIVLGLAACLQPRRIALDFDRTLATTRSGAVPIVGEHNVDHELLSLLWCYPGACVVVTRNSHTREIGQFLLAHGAPEDVQIISLKRPASKAEHVLADLEREDAVIFVDDSMSELFHPRFANDERVHRVLFVRAML